MRSVPIGGNEQPVLNGKVKITAALMLVTAILTLITAFAGVFNSQIYMDLVADGSASHFAVAGAVNQDILSIPCGLALLVIAILLYSRKSYKLLIIALGLVGYILYGYAVYTFGIMLTPLYLAYIATFALSVYCLIMGVLSFDHTGVGRLRLGKGIRLSMGVFLVLMTTVLSLKWISDILAGTLKQSQPELYLIAALDLSVALPAIGLSAAVLLRNRPYGVIFSGIVLVKIFTLCLSIALGTFVAPYFGLPADYGTFGFFAMLAVVSLVFKVLFIRGVSLEQN